MSTLTGFFAYCVAGEDECPFTYQEFPQHFVWLKSEKRWKSREMGYEIGRMYFANPNCGERFYLCKCLIDFPLMPQPTANWSAVVGNRLIFEHQQLQNEAQQADPQITIDCLNNGQRNAYNTITSSIFQNKGTVFFLNGVLEQGKHLCHTTHSTFSIPLDVLENLLCGFTKQSLQAELFRETKLIIWDEVLMQHRLCVETVDRTLSDIRDNEKPFGGITVVLGGDFQQILPIIPKGVREQIVNASLRHSIIWKRIHILTLDLNMCLHHGDHENAIFANFLMDVTLL
ncbi:uncharacterized protein LOC114263349 [Camellia sinensis]|uniref:uncharacterized protein LOC114263349 n=1 Tax=Camellia sinensis TaxID=4442 RepID=UPI001035D775|nr:uncharacterized protein LOC114263349 [Camellia sinensis]